MPRHLFVPGLLGPAPRLEPEWQPRLPRLERLLACADRQPEPLGFAGGLFALFGIETAAASDIPTAAVCFLADTGEAPPGFLLHADPLQLHPDRDRLLAFDLDDDPLDTHETAQVVETFNVHYADDGLRLYASPAGRLYLHSERTPSLRTQPLSAVIGRSVDGFLPDGEDRHRWRGLLNETQMLCHALEINREREARGRPLLGGLWFSGGGTLPTAAPAPAVRLRGDCVLSRGLLALHRTATGEEQTDELIVDHAPGRAAMRADPDAWRRALVALEGQMADLLQGGGTLWVHPGNGIVYRWHARTARRFWRRKRPLAQYRDAHR